jgi:hypothetical protein
MRACAAEEPEIEYLDEESFKHFMRSRRKPLSGILQQFIEPRGGYNSSIRAVWAPKLCLCERRDNVRRLWDTRFSVFERAVTFEGRPHNSVLTPVRGSALPRQVQGICESIVFHVAQVTNLKTRISRMVLNLKTDAHGKLLILWATSIRTEGERETLADAEVVMGGSSAVGAQSGKQAIVEASRKGLSVPSSVMGPLSLSTNMTIPTASKPDLDTVVPVLAPGLQQEGSSPGKAPRGHHMLLSEGLSDAASDVPVVDKHKKRRNSLVLDNDDMQVVAEAGDSIASHTPEKRFLTRAMLSPLEIQGSSVEQGLAATELERDLSGLPVLCDRQCPSCGAAIAAGHRSGPVSGKPATSDTSAGLAVQYKTIVQHYEAVVSELGLDLWWQVDGTVPPEDLDEPASVLSTSITSGPPPVTHCPEASLWPHQTDLVMSAAGGVGMYGLFDREPRPPVHPIPHLLRLIHRALPCSEYRWYKQDPLFLYKNTNVCEGCFLVFAKFAQLVTEGKPSEFALRQCMGPRAAKRVARALMAGTVHPPNNRGTGGDAERRVAERAKARNQQRLAAQQLQQASATLAAPPKPKPRATKLIKKHRDAFSEFLAEQAPPPGLPPMSDTAASVMTTTNNNTTMGRASTMTGSATETETTTKGPAFLMMGAATETTTKGPAFHSGHPLSFMGGATRSILRSQDAPEKPTMRVTFEGTRPLLASTGTSVINATSMTTEAKRKPFDLHFGPGRSNHMDGTTKTRRKHQQPNKSPFAAPVDLPTDLRPTKKKTKIKPRQTESLSTKYGAKYDAGATTTTISAQGEEEEEDRAHEEFLAKTHEELQSQLAKRDELIELLGYNPVQQAAATTIQALARRRKEES